MFRKGFRVRGVDLRVTLEGFWALVEALSSSYRCTYKETILFTVVPYSGKLLRLNSLTRAQAPFSFCKG